MKDISAIGKGILCTSFTYMLRCYNHFHTYMVIMMFLQVGTLRNGHIMFLAK